MRPHFKLIVVLLWLLVVPTVSTTGKVPVKTSRHDSFDLQDALNEPGRCRSPPEPRPQAT